MNTVFVLRVCSPDLTSHKGFQWPSTIGAKVSAPDWSDNPKCGNGLHGWLHGAGDTSAAEHTNNPDAKWLCLEVDEDTIVDLNGKVKFPMAIVRFIGARKDAAQWIVEHDHLADPSIVIGHCATAGDRGTATVGQYGTATAGQYGTATAGDRGTATAGQYGTATADYHGTATAGQYGTATAGQYGMATAGDRGTATVGQYGKATAGYRGTATADYHGKATAGDGGTATAGDDGTATAGDRGTATAGDRGTATAGQYGKATAGQYGTATADYHGTATAGDGGTATAGDGGTATAGDGGEIRIRYLDCGRYRTALGYVGEAGILPNVPYRCNEQGELIKCTP